VRVLTLQDKYKAIAANREKGERLCLCSGATEQKPTLPFIFCLVFFLSLSRFLLLLLKSRSKPKFRRLFLGGKRLEGNLLNKSKNQMENSEEAAEKLQRAMFTNDKCAKNKSEQ
jgi:hypothetical protein